MMQLARSLRTRPDHELERAQAEAARAANREPSRKEKIRAELQALADKYGPDLWIEAGSMSRANRPQVIKFRPRARDAAEALFGKGGLE